MKPNDLKEDVTKILNVRKDLKKLVIIKNYPALISVLNFSVNQKRLLLIGKFQDQKNRKIKQLNINKIILCEC